MEQAAKGIKPFLFNEKYQATPLTCQKHMYEFVGWQFVNSFPSKVYSVERCINCGGIKHRYREMNAVGKNAFDLDDPRLRMGGIIGSDWLDREWEKEKKEVGW